MEVTDGMSCEDVEPEGDDPTIEVSFQMDSTPVSATLTISWGPPEDEEIRALVIRVLNEIHVLIRSRMIAHGIGAQPPT